MRKLLIGLIAILLLNSTPTWSTSSEDSTRTVSFAFLRAVLKKAAKLEQLVKDGKADSITIANLNLAYAEMKAALGQCREALAASGVKSQRQESLLAIAEKRLKSRDREIVKQKFLKWMGWVVAGIFAYLAVQQATK